MGVLGVGATHGCRVTGRALELRSDEHTWGQSCDSEKGGRALCPCHLESDFLWISWG